MLAEHADQQYRSLLQLTRSSILGKFMLQGAPFYAPTSVSFYFGCGPDSDAMQVRGPFTVKQHTELQDFRFQPMLCAGGELLVDILQHEQP